MLATPTYNVRTEVFEGPLELLLSLIEKRKLLINDISLATVTDDYMRHIEEMQQHPEAAHMAETAHFVVVASTLLLIKSKSLLPVLELTKEEEEDIEDLEMRLRLYQLFKEVSKDIEKQFGKKILFPKIHKRNTEPVFSPHKRITLEGVGEAIDSVLKALPKKQLVPKTVVKKVMSLEDMIDSLRGRIESTIRLSFKEFSGHGVKERVHVVVSFLAVLELVKQGTLSVRQEARFDDITIESDTVNTPRYF